MGLWAWTGVHKLCVVYVHVFVCTLKPCGHCMPMSIVYCCFISLLSTTPPPAHSPPTHMHYSASPPLLPPPQLTSIITVAYLSICAYFTVFKIRIFNFYYLAPRHGTDEYSLLFSAM